MRLINRLFQTGILCTFGAVIFCTGAFAATVKQRLCVAPWNGYKGAVSLTFDDGDPTQVNIAIPEMNKRNIKGTFFLISSIIMEKRKWKEVTAEGHEIASHSYSHKHPRKLSQSDVLRETKTARENLSREFHCPVNTFAYPYSEFSAPLKKDVAENYFAARAGWGPTYYLLPTRNPNWYKMPAQVAYSKMPLSTYSKWIDTAEKKNAWTIFMIHSLKGGKWGWQPLPQQTFTGILDKLQKSHVWAAPFGTVCAYWRAQKIFEKAKPVITPNGDTYKWNIPANFPKGVQLKITVRNAKGNTTLYQNNKQLSHDNKGYYTVDFNNGELICKG